MRKDRKGSSEYNKGKMGNNQANDLQHNILPAWQWESGEKGNSVRSESG